MNSPKRDYYWLLVLTDVKIVKGSDSPGRGNQWVRVDFWRQTASAPAIHMRSSSTLHLASRWSSPKAATWSSRLREDNLQKNAYTSASSLKQQVKLRLTRLGQAFGWDPCHWLDLSSLIPVRLGTAEIIRNHRNSWLSNEKRKGFQFKTAQDPLSPSTTSHIFNVSTPTCKDHLT